MLQLYNVGEPMECVALDVLGPLPERESRNKYILTAKLMGSLSMQGF